MSATVQSVVDDLACDGASGFYASHVMRKLGVDASVAHQQLADLVKDGLLDVQLEAICPNPGCHRTVASWNQGAEPLDLRLECTSCDLGEFEVDKDDLVIAYTPSRKLLLSINKSQKKNPGKVGAANQAVDTVGAAGGLVDAQAGTLALTASDGSQIQVNFGGVIAGGSVSEIVQGSEKVVQRSTAVSQADAQAAAAAGSAQITQTQQAAPSSQKKKTGSAVAITIGIVGCIVSIVVFVLLARHGTIRTGYAITLGLGGCALSCAVANMVAGHLRG